MKKLKAGKPGKFTISFKRWMLVELVKERYPEEQFGTYTLELTCKDCKKAPQCPFMEARVPDDTNQSDIPCLNV